MVHLDLQIALLQCCDESFRKTTLKAFQDYYPGELAHCYGCGSNNEHGHQLKSYWNGESTIARFTPRSYHTAIPGYVYGGLIASLIDCHGTGTAAAAVAKAQGRELDSQPPIRFVTASLKVDYLVPTPLGIELVLHGEVIEIGERKVIVEVKLKADDISCAKGTVIAVKMPEHMMSLT
jgi:acyl-coenzyme A thioesterase PaaI-like protein